MADKRLAAVRKHLTPGRVRIYEAFWDLGPITIRQAEEALGVNLSGPLLQGLVDEGLLERVDQVEVPSNKFGHKPAKAWRLAPSEKVVTGPIKQPGKRRPLKAGGMYYDELVRLRSEVRQLRRDNLRLKRELKMLRNGGG